QSPSLHENESAAETLIRPPGRLPELNLHEIWRYRDLLQLMILRDISARYRQSVIGYGWAIFKPVLTAAIFTLVFSLLVRIQTEVPYPIFAFSALIPWLYFSSTLTS